MILSIRIKEDNILAIKDTLLQLYKEHNMFWYYNDRQEWIEECLLRKVLQEADRRRSKVYILINPNTKLYWISYIGDSLWEQNIEVKL